MFWDTKAIVGSISPLQDSLSAHRSPRAPRDQLVLQAAASGHQRSQAAAPGKPRGLLMAWLSPGTRGDATTDGDGLAASTLQGAPCTSTCQSQASRTVPAVTPPHQCSSKKRETLREANDLLTEKRQHSGSAPLPAVPSRYFSSTWSVALGQ